MAGNDVQSLVIQLRAQGINVTEKQLRRLGNQANKTGMSLKGMVAAAGGIYTIGRAFTHVINVGKEFSASQSNLAAILGKSKKSLGDLDKTARELGATTKFTASQVVSLQTEFAKLGFTSQEIVNAQESTLSLASAVNVDLATAAEVAGQTLNAYQLDAEETGRVTDVMAKSFSSSALDMEKFRNSMTYVSVVAQQSGVSVEATTGILGKLADVGIDGSMAGTQLRRIMMEMGNESSKLSKKVGFSVKSSDDLFKALKILNKQGLSTAEMEDLVGKRAVAAFGSMIQMADGSEMLTKSLEDAAGAAKEMADKQLDNLEGDLFKLTSAVDGFSLSLYEGMQPALRDTVQNLTSLVEWLDPDVFIFLGQAVINGAIAFGVYKLAVAGVTVYMMGAEVAAYKATTAFLSFATSTGGILVAVMAVGAAITWLTSETYEYADAIEIAEGHFDKAFTNMGSYATQLSKTTRKNSVDMSESYAIIQNAQLTMAGAADTTLEGNLKSTNEEIDLLQSKTRKLDVLNGVIRANAGFYGELTKTLNVGNNMNKNATITIESNAKALNNFSYENDNAVTILKNLDQGVQANVKSIKGFSREIDDGQYGAWRYNYHWRILNGGLKGSVKNIEDAKGGFKQFSIELDSNQKISAKTTASLNTITYQLENYYAQSKLIHRNITGTEAIKWDADFFNTRNLKNSINSALAMFGEYDKEQKKYIDVVPDVDRAEGFSDIMEEYRAILQEIIDEDTGDFTLEFKSLVDVDDAEMQQQIQNLQLLAQQYQEMLDVDASEQLANAQEEIRKVMNELTGDVEKAKQSSMARTLALYGEKEGIESISQGHLDLVSSLYALEDANGNRKYTDEEILALMISTKEVTQKAGEDLQYLTLAQITYNAAMEDATTVSKEEEAQMIQSLIAHDKLYSAYTLSADNIDGMVQSMKTAISEGKSMEEALALATNVAVGTDTDDEAAEKKKEKQKEELEARKEYLQNLVEETKLYSEEQLQAQKTLLDEQMNLMLTEADNLQYSEELKQAIRDDFAKKKKDLDKEEVLATHKKHEQMADSIAGWSNAIASVWQATGKNAELVTNLQYIEAIANTYSAASKAYHKFGGWPGGVAPAALSVVQGMAQVAAIKKARDDAKAQASKSVKAQYGANFITNGLTNLTVGDNPGGKEMVNVVPLSSPNTFGDPNMMGGGTTLNVQVSGNVMSKEFVEEELVESLNEAIRQGNILVS